MRVLKSRYWAAILYPENMQDNWKEILPDRIQLPFCYCLHDKDVLSVDFELIDNAEQLTFNIVEERKAHVHLLLCYDGPTTAANVKTICNRLAIPGRVCCPVCEPVICMRQAYDYLIHNTAAAKEAGKYQYSKKERISGNNFDIDLYSNITTAQKDRALDDIEREIMCRKITNMIDVFKYVELMGDEEGVMKAALRSHSGYIERLVKGMFHKVEQAAAAANSTSK